MGKKSPTKTGFGNCPQNIISYQWAECAEGQNHISQSPEGMEFGENEARQQTALLNLFWYFFVFVFKRKKQKSQGSLT